MDIKNIIKKYYIYIKEYVTIIHNDLYIAYFYVLIITSYIYKIYLIYKTYKLKNLLLYSYYKFIKVLKINHCVISQT